VAFPQHEKQGEAMRDWNTVATLRGEGFEQAIETLSQLGPVARTQYFNVLVMHLDDISLALEELRQRITADCEGYDFLGRLAPLTRVFNFGSPEQFEERARQAVLTWPPVLAGKSFHVRMHRRGFKGRISSMKEEQFLDETLIKAMREAGNEARISFVDPDVIIAVETLDQRGGLSLWTRHDLERYPFLRLD
jgi:tRNA(Ser,Leu) C12 N-acetylase TAN1